MPILSLMSKIIFMKYLLPVQHVPIPKWKSPEFLEIWYIWYSNYVNLDFTVKKNYEIFTTCLAKIGPKIKSTQNLLKFGTLEISNMPISILILKMIFIKYLPHVRPILVSKLKVPWFIDIWYIWYFKYADLDFNVKNDFY